MRAPRRSLPRAFLVAAICLTAPASAPGATVRQLTLKELAQAATVVVSGRVEAADARWLHGRIFTRVALVAAAVLKGPVKAGQPVAFEAPGGEVGDIGQLVPGAPAFEPGEEAVVFLEPAPIGWVVVGLGLGKLRPERGADGALWVVRDDAPDLAPGLRASWDELAATVRATR